MAWHGTGRLEGLAGDVMFVPPNVERRAEIPTLLTTFFSPPLQSADSERASPEMPTDIQTYIHTCHTYFASRTYVPPTLGIYIALGAGNAVHIGGYTYSGVEYIL